MNVPLAKLLTMGVKNLFFLNVILIRTDMISERKLGPIVLHFVILSVSVADKERPHRNWYNVR